MRVEIVAVSVGIDAICLYIEELHFHHKKENSYKLVSPVSWYICVGIAPVKEFEDITRVFSPLNRPSSVGMVPLNWLEFICLQNN